MGNVIHYPFYRIWVQRLNRSTDNNKQPNIIKTELNPIHSPIMPIKAGPTNTPIYATVDAQESAAALDIHVCRPTRENRIGTILEQPKPTNV